MEGAFSRPERRRAMFGIFASSALAATGYIPAFGVAPLVVEDMLGSPVWSGLPGALAIGGLAVGSALLSAIMARRHQGFGLLVGFALACGASVAAGLAAGLGSILWFLVSMLLFGVGFGARHLARYVAGGLYPAAYRSTAISLVVWAGTAGAVFGPLLIAPSQQLAEVLDLPGLSGPYLLAALASGLAWLSLLLLLPGRRWLDVDMGSNATAGSAPRPWWELAARPRVCFAITTLVIGQFVMVLIMSMTPVHIRHAGEDLGTVGMVLSAHTFGMFAISPLTGLLSDRWGRLPVILAGVAMLFAAALLAAPSSGGEKLLMVASLGLLGIGWNFGFVAGSALLSEAVVGAERLRLQGATDTLVWLSAAGASLISGGLLSAGGYATLNLIGAVMCLLPPWAALRWRMRDERPNRIATTT